MDVKKKITGFLFIVLLCVFVFPVALSADEGYALYVGGVQVTNDNASDILGDGTASYDPASATLTLNNANLTEGALLPDPTAIECYGDLNIVLNGENTIDVRGKNVMGIYCKGELTFTGGGSLALYADLPGILCEGSLTVDGTKVNLDTGSSDGIMLLGGLYIQNGADVSVDCSSANGDAISLYNSDSVEVVISDSSAFINNDAGAGISSTGNITFSNSIIQAFSADESISSTGALTITGGNIFASSVNSCAVSTENNLSISSAIILANAQNNTAVHSDAAITITGSYVGTGSLLTNGSFSAQSIAVSGSWVDTNDGFSPEINASINDSVIFEGKSGTVTGNYSVPAGFGMYVSEECTLTIPEGASFTVQTGAEFSNDGTVIVNGEFIVEEGGIVACKEGHHIDLVKTEAKAATFEEDGNIEYWHCSVCGKYYSDAAASNEIAYGDTIIRAISKGDWVTVGSVLVTSENAKDILGDGTASYDFDTAMLTLKGANITDCYGSEYEAIGSGKDLTIVLEGENTIDIADKWGDNDAILSRGDLTIKGNGSLTVISGESSIGCCGTLTIEGVDLAVRSETGVYYAVYAFEGSDESKGEIVIKDASVDIAATASIGIYVLGDLNVTGSYVTIDAAEGATLTDALNVAGSWIEMNSEFDKDMTLSVADSAVLIGNDGEVTGNLVLPYSIELAAGKTLTIPEGASVTVPAGVTFTNAGTVVLNGEFAVEEGGKGVCISEHTGGTATETSMAVCEICGEEYGELKPSDTGKGDEDINKPGGNDKTDEGGKLDKTPETGDRNDTAVWVVLIAAAGAALAGSAAYKKRRR